MAFRRKQKNAFSGSHQRSWLWGRHAVLETLQSGTWPVLEIFASAEAYEQSARLFDEKQAAGVQLQIVDHARLEQLTHSTEHQGLAVRLGAYPYCSMAVLEESVQRSLSEAPVWGGASRPLGSGSALVVVCDRIQDAFNFGAILRGCDGANVLGVIVGDREQAEVTPHVARSSSGAVNYIPIIRQPDLVQATLRLKALGMQIVAANAGAGTVAWDACLSGPVVLIVGSEAHGICSALMSHADQHVVIPMQGRVTSLNVAVATGILLYEIRRQQNLPT